MLLSEWISLLTCAALLCCRHTVVTSGNSAWRIDAESSPEDPEQEEAFSTIHSLCNCTSVCTLIISILTFFDMFVTSAVIPALPPFLGGFIFHSSNVCTSSPHSLHSNLSLTVYSASYPLWPHLSFSSTRCLLFRFNAQKKSLFPLLPTGNEKCIHCCLSWDPLKLSFNGFCTCSLHWLLWQLCGNMDHQTGCKIRETEIYHQITKAQSDLISKT